MSKKVTVLEALQWPTVGFDASWAPPGPNTTVVSELNIEPWVDWTDFTFENIISVFGGALQQTYQGQKEPKPLAKDLQVHDEASADDGLRRFQFPIINNALESMMESNAPYYGRGSKCFVSKYKPDWSCTSDLAKEDWGYLNLVPGDTKTSPKFKPAMVQTNFAEWRKVVTQVAAYVDDHSVRYGFIVTDEGAVVLRFAHQVTARGIGARLPQRSTRSDPVQLSSDPSLPSSESYQGGTQGSDLNIEYKAIPWCLHGRNQLTAKLALAVLAMMSLKGDNNISYKYPGLNTWRTALPWEAGVVTHNTSGVALGKVTRNMVMEEPCDEEHDEEYDEKNDDGNDEYDEDENEDDEDENEDDGDEDEVLIVLMG